MTPNDHWDVIARIIIALIGGLPAMIAASAAFITALRAARRSTETAVKVDGLIGQLLQEAKDRARLEGVLEGQADAAGIPTAPRKPTRVERGYPSGPNPDLPTPK